MQNKMCRACLSTENVMFPFDESFVSNYNLLTNLKIALSDEKPQFSCITCLDNVKCFTVFREKSIQAEAILNGMLENVKLEKEKLEINEKLEIDVDEKLQFVLDEKPPIDQEPAVFVIKNEIKEESVDKFEYELTYSDSEANEIINNVLNKKDKTNKKSNKIVSTLKKERPARKCVKPTKKSVKPTKKSAKPTKKSVKKKVIELQYSEWYCGICPESFDSKPEMNQHLNSHKKDRECHLCKVKVDCLSQLYTHRLNHIPPGQHKNCHICDKKFVSCPYLEFHYRNVHIEEDDKRIVCEKCKIYFSSPRKYSRHMNAVHPKAEINFICDLCAKSFQNRQSMISHIRSHGLNKLFRCDMCDFTCKQNTGLFAHKMRKHNPEKVNCNTCKKIFPNQAAYDKHNCRNIYVLCPVCGVQFARNALNRHMNSHSDECKYKCTRCPAKFKAPTSLALHLNRHDGNRTQHCEYCPAKFYSATVLIKHRRIHTGEKPYVCQECNKAFTARNNLKVHMKVHGINLINSKKTESEINFNNIFG